MPAAAGNTTGFAVRSRAITGCPRSAPATMLNRKILAIHRNHIIICITPHAHSVLQCIPLGSGGKGHRASRREPSFAQSRCPEYRVAVVANGMSSSTSYHSPRRGTGFTLKPGDIVVMDDLGSHKSAQSTERSAPPVPACASCRPPPPTSIRSSRSFPGSSPGSRRFFAGRRNAPSTAYGGGSARCSIASHRPNAPTTLATPVMLRSQPERL
jgi:hypothetical protein